MLEVCVSINNIILRKDKAIYSAKIILSQNFFFSEHFNIRFETVNSAHSQM